MVMRNRLSVVLVKAESSEGTDSSPSTSTDGVLFDGTPRLSLKPNIVQTNEASSSLDGFGRLVGGMTVGFDFDVFLKGSGTAGTAPDYGKLLKACGMAETLTATAVPASAEAAAAGSANTLTLASGATGTAQLYRYMPLLLSGNPSPDAISFITNYTSGKVATLTETFGTPLDTGTSYQVLKNVLYVPASASIPSNTMYFYIDGIRYRFVGCRGTWSLSMESGGPAKLTFSFMGMFLDKTDASLVTPTLTTVRPPLWKGGVMSIDRVAAALKTLSFTANNKLAHPDNPNSQEGYDPAQITGRDLTGNMDPLETLIATRDIMADFRAGTKRIIHARLGTAVGNRIGVTVAQALYTDQAPGDRDGFATVSVPFDCVGQDSGIGICLY